MNEISVELSSIIIDAEIKNAVTFEVTLVGYSSLSIEDITPEAIGAARADHKHATYIHNQMQALSEWRITHGLGKYPSVTIVDSAGTEVEGNADYESEDVVVVKFSGAFSGKAYLN